MVIQFSSIDLRSIRINKDHQETIFSQLCRGLRELILAAKLPVESRLPSTRMLAAELGVSRISVREAYEQLVAEGFLISIAGRGTFVGNDNGLKRAILAFNNAKSANNQSAEQSLHRDISSRAKAFLSVSQSNVIPEALPFNPATPDFSEFPWSKWNSTVKKSMLEHKYEAMDYGDPEGFPALRGALAHYLGLARGINCQPEQIVITASSEQTIRRTAFLLLDPKDSVWFGEPGMYTRRNAFCSLGVNTLTVPVDESGVVVSAVYDYGKKAKLAYVLPYRHYPIGITMSLSRRHELLDWATKNDAWILEDDYASEFGLPDHSPPTIQSLDTDQRVIYMGGFSLTLFPALRLSYAVFPKPLADAAIHIARSEMAVSSVLQPALAEFITRDHYITHIRKMRKVYKRREDFLVQYLQQHIGPESSISGIRGGTNIVLNLPPQYSAIEISRKLAQQDIIAHPISSYYLNKPTGQKSRNGLVLGFACASRMKLQKAATVMLDLMGHQ
ncbi:MAG: GntR family transcriptional regulator/MocR family aminotransferase [Parasphingorhabdus sp.]|jgi:GntR family transcriptional regulator/MocR family aminotransferase